MDTTGSPHLSSAHGSNTSGGVASCRQLSELSIVDCTACLAESFAALKTSLAPAEVIVADQLLDDLRSLGKAGASKGKLKVSRVEIQGCDLWASLSATRK
jgi:hypothetical protein